MKIKVSSLKHITILFFVLIFFSQCKDVSKSEKVPSVNVVSDQKKEEKKDTVYSVVINKPEEIEVPKGMVWIPGGEFMQGAVPQDKMAMQHEKPAHKVAVDGFFMDITEVTNAQFSKFVKETEYITVAERAIDWEEMKKQVPAGTPKPHDSILQPGSLTFKKAKTSVPNLFDFSQWWDWTIGANWKHPDGPNSSIKGLENHPVVQICYEDAMAYCNWAGRRLPTEAEWEYAANGGKSGTIFFWGDDMSVLSKNANSWEGEFPVENSKKDGYEKRAPVKSYQPNGYGLYDMAGNVWEWTSDWYNVNYYKEQSAALLQKNPKGATEAYNPQNVYIEEKVIKGGSFLCSDSYCASYRISARMGSSTDSSAEHTGFRTVVSVKMLK